jgi:hypothetical protein
MNSPIPAIVPRNGSGHQFVCYADSCSGVPGAPHESTFASVNRVVSRLRPQPEFICFPGDEIAGLVANDDVLRSQWRHWFNSEMAWLDRRAIPLYHTTGNHTTYDTASEKVFREVLNHLPRNGPSDQAGLTYFVRRDDLLLAFVNTAWSGLGGEGRVETEWLDQTLCEHADARFKIVLGHHPVFSVNGFAGPFQRDIESENGRAFWRILVRHQVLAYIGSHILAFDVQVHDGVLQIVTAGAGTAHRMPPEHEYLHCVQAALDGDGLRYQVLDITGVVREWLAWPLILPPAAEWCALSSGENRAPRMGDSPPNSAHSHLLAFGISGLASSALDGSPQTILMTCNDGASVAPLWIGLTGAEQRLTVLLSPAPGRSPHHWYGPCLPPGSRFEFQLVLHTGMGPGGLLWRTDENTPWTSLRAASPWGAERLSWPSTWIVRHALRGPTDRPFRGSDLRVTWHSQQVHLFD